MYGVHVYICIYLRSLLPGGAADKTSTSADMSTLGIGKEVMQLANTNAIGEVSIYLGRPPRIPFSGGVG